MNKYEENANTEILNPSADADLGDITGAAQDEERETEIDESDGLLKYQYEKLALANERLEDENERLRDVHKLRKEYIPKLFGLTCVWLVVVAVFLWKVAGGRDFYLYDNVLIALITSTTINVIGIFLIAARWLFPTQK